MRCVRALTVRTKIDTTAIVGWQLHERVIKHRARSFLNLDGNGYLWTHLFCPGRWTQFGRVCPWGSSVAGVLCYRRADGGRLRMAG
jgi:hypothetical protein